MKKCTSAILVITLLVSLVSAYALEEESSSLQNFTLINSFSRDVKDIQSSDWFYESVETVYEYGIMTGRSATEFKPKDSITIAEVLTIAARIRSIYDNDVIENSPTDVYWYDKYVSYLKRKAIINNEFDGMISLQTTREQLAGLFAVVLPSVEYTAINQIGYIPDISNSKLCEKVLFLYNAGILTGSDSYGTFYPNRNISRAEVATIITRLIKPDLRKVFNLDQKKVDRVQLDRSTLLLKTGESAQLNATLYPLDAYNNNVVWVSEDTSVVTVDDKGFVTSVFPGKTQITVTSENGISAVCEIIVEPKIKAVTYEWEYPIGLLTWTYTLNIPEQAYEIYAAVDRASIFGYKYYVTHDADDEYLEALAAVFKNTADDENLTEWDMVELVVSFVQNLDYIPDSEIYAYGEYPKFPLETLYDKGGDCEDTSILLASLLRGLGYGVVLTVFDDHMGVGILCDDSDCNFKYGNDYFYYIETTGMWSIGEIPQELEGKTFTVMPLD